MKIVSFISAMAAAGMVLIADSAFAHDSAGPQVQAALLLQQTLPDAAGKKAIMLTVNYAPGQASAPHYHPGSVFAYVLEGEVISQLEGHDPVKYKAGDYWYEPPKAPHIVSRNASTTAPARLLVWLLVGDGEQAKLPLKK